MVEHDRPCLMPPHSAPPSQMWREEGARAFLKGLGPRVMLIPPMFAITMTCFEVFQGRWFPQTVAAPGLK